MARIIINRIIPQIIAKIKTETFCGGTCAKSQSFNNIPFRFSIMPKKNGSNNTTISIITEPITSLFLSKGVFHIFFQLFVIDDGFSGTKIKLTIAKVIIDQTFRNG